MWVGLIHFREERVKECLCFVFVVDELRCPGLKRKDISLGLLRSYVSCGFLELAFTCLIEELFLIRCFYFLNLPSLCLPFSLHI